MINRKDMTRSSINIMGRVSERENKKKSWVATQKRKELGADNGR